MLLLQRAGVRRGLKRALAAVVTAGRAEMPTPSLLPRRQQVRGKQWSVEHEHGHTYEDPEKIIDEALINRLLEQTKAQAKDPQRVAAILAAAQERARLKGRAPGSSHAFDPDDPKSEFVQGLTLEEAATLLNVDAGDPAMVQPLYDAALNVKEQIYGA